MSNLASGGKIWSHVLIKARDKQALKRYLRNTFIALVVGLLFTLLSLWLASMFDIDSAFTMVKYNKTLHIQMNNQYGLFFVSDVIGSVAIIGGLLGYFSYRMPLHEQWFLVNKKRIVLGCSLVFMLWLTAFILTTNTGKEMNHWDKVGGQELSEIKSWAKEVTGSSITTEQARQLVKNTPPQTVNIKSHGKILTFVTSGINEYSIEIEYKNRP